MKDHHIDIHHIARLARLRLTGGEAEQFARQLDAILGYVDKLSELDLDNLDPSAHAGDITDVLRDDEPRACLTRDAALGSAPKQNGEQFIVPKVVE